MHGYLKRFAKPKSRTKNFVISDDGFTLMELSTVIMIISVLVLIALPVFLTVIQNSQLKTCLSTLKTIDRGIQRYIVDKNVEPSNLGDVAPVYVIKIPSEPTGGTYTFTAATSSVPAHVECSKGHSY